MEAKLSFIGHALMENRNGLSRRGTADQCIGSCRETGRARYRSSSYADRATSITLGGDKGFDAADFIMKLREIERGRRTWPNTRPAGPPSTGARLRHPGYDISQRVRKRIEEGFGWMKTIGGMRKPKYRSREKVAWSFTFAAAAYNLIRLPKLMAQRA